MGNTLFRHGFSRIGVTLVQDFLLLIWSQGRGVFSRSALLALFVLATCLVSEGRAEEIRFALGDQQRRALVVNAAPTGPKRPFVIVLHGGRGSAEEMQRRTGFSDLARRENFGVAYAEGTAWGRDSHAWNTGHLLRRQVGNADDIAYLDTLIDVLLRRYGADPQRIYMTGGSNGAMMIFVYAVRRPEKLAAIAPVVGAMFSFEERPRLPLPIMMINGAADNEVPIQGGMSQNRQVRAGQTSPFKSLAETVDFWATANRSQRPPKSQTTGTYTTHTYSALPGGAVTISIVDSVGGHGWPGTASRRAENTPISSFNGAEKIWSFLRTQRR
jgi:polyhydroxybutyrate depolymerase